MSGKPSIGFGIAAALAVLWILIGLNTVAMIREMTAPTTTASALFVPCDSIRSLITLADKALARFSTTGDDVSGRLVVKNPFQAGESMSASHNSSGTGRVLSQRGTLKLRGILVKKNPLAILEDERRKTYICMKGDTIGTAIVQEIKEEEAILRDAGGSFTLRVAPD